MLPGTPKTLEEAIQHGFDDDHPHCMYHAVRDYLAQRFQVAMMREVVDGKKTDLKAFYDRIVVRDNEQVMESCTRLAAAIEAQQQRGKND